MKKFEIIINGEHEEAIGKEILAGIYEAVQSHGYTDVSVKADTYASGKKNDLKIPGFLHNYNYSSLEQERKAVRG